jgi:two-component system, cell cycle sensor histidine kinase and response regulator CckA
VNSKDEQNRQLSEEIAYLQRKIGELEALPAALEGETGCHFGESDGTFDKGIPTVSVNTDEGTSTQQTGSDGEKIYSSIFEHTGQMAYDADMNTGKVSWTGAIEEVTGFTVDEFRNVDWLSWKEMIHPDDRHLAMSAMTQSPATAAQYRHEYRLKKKDGVSILAEDCGVLLVSGAPAAYRTIGTIRDVSQRKEMERTMKESERRYRAIFENAGTVLLFAEEDTTISLVNKEFERVTGYSRGDLEGKRKWTEFVADGEDLRRMIEYGRVRGLDPDNAPRAYETHLVNKAGDVRDALVTVDLIPETRQTLATLTDITDRNKAEQSLRESEQALRTIFENAHDAIFIHDLDGHVLDANQRVLDLYGVTMEQALNMSIAEDFSARDNPVDQLESRWRRVLEGESITFEWKAKRPNVGSSFDVEVALKRITLRNREVILANVRDISVRKAAEAMLRENEERFRVLAENNIDTIMRFDKEHRHLYVNPIVEEMTGISPADFVDKTHEEMGFPASLCSIWTEAIDQVFRSGKVHRIEFQLPNGVWIDWMLMPELNESGQAVGVITSGRDVTERKQAEEEKAATEAQVVQSQKMQAIGQLAGGVAHDFNNILTVILGFGSLIQMALDRGQPARKEYIDQVLESANKAANLTQSLLAFSRKQQIKLEPRNLNDVVATTGKLLMRLVTEDVDVRIACAHEPLVVMADSTQIDQILINLAANARDAMPRGGMLFVETSTAVMDNNFKRLHGYGEPGNYAVISVSDTGTGMDEETRKHIFEPFFTTKELGRGTGLGLATVYGIVKQHNGYIDVYSERHQGTTFRIYLPLVDMAGRDDSDSLPKEIKGGTETILVVEDDPSVRQLITATLTIHGYTTLEATDGRDGIDNFLKNKETIDLVLLDVVMPTMNGKEACEEIRKVRPDVKVIFMSGYTMDVLTQKGVEAEGADYVSKPLSSRPLLAKVREVLDK